MPHSSFLTDGTNPRGLPYQVNGDGTVGIGNYTLSVSDFEALTTAVRRDEAYEAALATLRTSRSKRRAKGQTKAPVKTEGASDGADGGQ